jgi:hypothetical protein
METEKIKTYTKGWRECDGWMDGYRRKAKR